MESPLNDKIERNQIYRLAREKAMEGKKQKREQLIEEIKGAV